MSKSGVPRSRDEAGCDGETIHVVSAAIQSLDSQCTPEVGQPKGLRVCGAPGGGPLSTWAEPTTDGRLACSAGASGAAGAGAHSVQACPPAVPCLTPHLTLFTGPVWTNALPCSALTLETLPGTWQLLALAFASGPCQAGAPYVLVTAPSLYRIRLRYARPTRNRSLACSTGRYQSTAVLFVFPHLQHCHQHYGRSTIFA